MNDHELRHAGLLGCGRVHMQGAEQASKGEVLFLRDVLVAKKDDEMLGERAMDFRFLLLGQRLREIDACDLAADDRREFVDANRLVWITRLGEVPIARTAVALQWTGLHGRSDG